jgi:hypothetical protein
MILPDTETTLPPLRLEGNDKNEAYTTRFTLAANSAQELSWARSVFSGAKLLDFAVVRHWSTRDPSLTADNLQTKLESFLSGCLLQRCITEYNLADNIQCPEGTTIGESVCRDFLAINVAKLYDQVGMPSVQEWVSALVDAGATPPAKSINDAVAEPSKILVDPSGSGTPAPPYSPPIRSSGGSVGEDPLALVTLAVFNEYATQKKNHKVVWQAESSGDHHRPTWTVKCLLDGQVKGTGEGRNQKAAKEEAAREAWRTMGWSIAAPEPTSPPLSPLAPRLASLSISANPDDSIPALFTLSIFNQKAQQQRHIVDWNQSSVGDHRMQYWTANCIVDGQAMGTGEGNTLKEAKLSAARIAWRLMGWGGMPTIAADNGSNAG